MNKPTIWIFSLEPISTRYTEQWHRHVPALLKNKLGDRFNVVQIDGVQKNSQLTPGAFLNFSDTNYWKSAQMCAFLEQHNQGKTGPNDHFIFTDAWNPTVIQLKYMSDLLGFNWTLHGLFHAGSYDPQDFLGRLIGNKPWVRHAEKSFFHCYDHNYFATEFHIKIFVDELLKEEVNHATLFNSRWLDKENKIVKTGWPMEYIPETLAPYKNISKENLILFPHRLAPEKQVEIFQDLKKQIPQYEFVVCQEKSLTKHEYHTLLGQSKVVFSANLQETLGISWYEGSVVNSIPMVPDRLSYTESALGVFKYPSQWTESFDSYLENRNYVIERIVEYIENYEDFLPNLNKQTELLTKNFFSCGNLLKMLK